MSTAETGIDSANGFLYQSHDTEKVRQLLERNGLRLPTPLTLSDSDITVPQKEQFVNNHSMQSNEKNASEALKKEASQSTDVLNPGVTPENE